MSPKTSSTTLENVARALEPLPLRHEILVIDDGSTDATAALVTSSLKRFPAVRLLVNERNMGFGWSYRRGVEAAALDHIVMVHGDNAWGFETLREFFSHVGRGGRDRRLHPGHVGDADHDADADLEGLHRWW